MICVIKNLTRNFCYFLFISISWLWSDWQWHCRTSIEEEIVKDWMQGHLELFWLPEHLFISFEVNLSVKFWSIFQMLSDLETCVHHNLILLPRRCDLDFPLVRRNICRIFSLWDDCKVQFLHSDDRDMTSWKVSSCICASVSRRTSAWKVCTDWRAEIYNTKMRNIIIREVYESSAALYSASSRTFPKLTNWTWLVPTGLNDILLLVTSFL